MNQNNTFYLSQETPKLDEMLSSFEADPFFWEEKISVAVDRLLATVMPLLNVETAHLWQLAFNESQLRLQSTFSSVKVESGKDTFVQIASADYLAALTRQRPFTTAQAIDSFHAATQLNARTECGIHIPVIMQRQVWGVLIVRQQHSEQVWSEHDRLSVFAVSQLIARLLLEHHLDHAEKRFDRLTQSAPMAIMEFDDQQNITYRNNQMVELFGTDHRRFTPEIWSSCVTTADGHDIEQDVKTVERSGTLLGNFRITRPDGSARYVLWHVVKADPPPGSTASYGRIGIAFDITPLWEVQQQLRDLTLRQSAIVDNAAHGIIATDKEGRITLFNAAAERLLGYRADEVLGKQPSLFLTREILEEFRSELKHRNFAHRYEGMIQQLQEETIVERLWPCIRKDGSRVPILVTSTLLQNAQGEPVGLVGLWVDQTDLQRLAAIEQREKELILHIARGTSAAVGERFFDHLANELRQATGADYVNVLLRLPELEGVRGILLNKSTIPELHHGVLDLINSPVESTMRDGKFVHLQNVQAEFPSDPFLKQLALMEFIAVPALSSSGEVLGAIVLAHCGLLPDPSLAERLLQIFAVRASSELERLRNAHILEARELEQKWLYEASVAIHVQQTIVDVARAAAIAGANHPTAPRVTVLLNEGSVSRVVDYAGPSRHAPTKQSFMRRPGGALKGGNTVKLMPTFQQSVVGDEIYAEAIQRDIQAMAIIGLMENGVDIGMVTFEYSNATALTQLDLDMLGTYGRAVSLGFSRAQHREALQYQAEHDSLTGLSNRSVLHREFANWKENGGNTTAFFLLDLNRFKEVNDSLGHHVGDALLCKIGKRIETGLNHQKATVARLGGDEFAVLFQGRSTSEARARVLANNILQALLQPFSVNGINLEIGASIGVALFPQHGEDSHALLRAADVAMYEAKRTGAGITLYRRDIDLNTPERLALISDFNVGIRQRQLRLFYQPKINLLSGQIIGFEALLRWQHPTLGLLSPDKFLPMVEMTDAIHGLTQAVLEMACECLSHWIAADKPWTLSVNLSARNLVDDRIVQYLSQLLKRFQIPAERLELEITETALIQDPDHALRLLDEIAATGVALSIDDFGTGYSSLAYLRDMPISTLKVDRTFVRDMLIKPQDQLIVRSIVQLAHSLDLKVIAEGVETHEVLMQLHNIGCDQAQGYYFSKPLPLQELQSWIKQFELEPKLQLGLTPRLH